MRELDGGVSARSSSSPTSVRRSCAAARRRAGARLRASTARSPALGVDVDIVSLVGRSERGGDARRSRPGVREMRVPQTAEHDGAECQLHARAGVPATDIALALHHDLTPAYGEALADGRRGRRGGRRVPPVRPAGARGRDATLPLIYEAQDVEADLKAAMFAGSDGGGRARRSGARGRGRVLRAGGAHDRLRGRGRRRGSASCTGCPRSARSSWSRTASTRPRSRSRRSRRARERRRALGLDDGQLALFLGSWHEPNLAAVRDMLAAAEALPERALPRRRQRRAGVRRASRLPGNVDLCGVVDDGLPAQRARRRRRRAEPDALGLGHQPEDARLRARRRADRLDDVRRARARPRGRRALRGDRARRAGGRARRAARRAAGGRRTRATRAAADHVRERFAWDAIAARWRAHPALRELLEGAAVA